MNEDDQLHERFRRMGFAGEPPMASTATDDLARGRRHLRRRRAVTLTGGVVGVVAVAAGVAFALPGGGPSGAEEVPVAGRGAGDAPSDAPADPSGGTTATPTEAPTSTPTAADTPADTPSADGLGFPATRQLLLDTAVEHLDPAHEHLPAETSGINGGGTNVGTKLEWLVDGDDGMGLVQVAVTGPGYAEEYDYARQDFAVNIGCEIDTDRCTEQPIPGTDETALVGAANPNMHLLYSIVYERADGSLVGIAVRDLFGNNSLTPLAEMDVSLDQGFAFVTDPDLRVSPDELDDDTGVGGVTLPEGSGTTELPEGSGESELPDDE
ncbi:hypothetical protein [Jiangella alba]|uniref:Uncharacterized protein n=1 Tax=Jiangella alba TaxID=561176 RepID=A0A1H5M3X9_9ACTN|nr:hypothetical protein [Jiangella alba]SEE84129.1 hypothetical protein SAMN04488561_2931 [Jiangella alba]